MKSPTERFSDRVGDYIKYRPSYPDGVITTLRDECGLTPATVVADVGAGTGILTRLLLDTKATVIAVEPNAEMRGAAEQMLGDYPGFSSVNGRAEATGLPAASVDIVAAAQAFHWFDTSKTKREFARILKPGGWVALIWNERRIDSAFGRAYEELLHRYSTDYADVGHRQITDDTLAAFYSPGRYETAAFPNHQDLTLDGLQGRVMSASYAPAAGHPKHRPMIEALHALFNAHQTDGLVRFEYTTQIYYGQFFSE
jgi:ubiquinone/menaquinone biosynthesis C-methylase UbiE